MDRKAETTVEQKRILGIDYGSRRIGVAMSDPLRIIASSYATLENRPDIWENLRRIVDEQQVEFIVVGMPWNLKGEQGAKAREVEAFIRELKDRVGKEVVTWDERFTTSIARQSLITMGSKKKERRNAREKIDAMAAALILQGFLDRTKKSLSC